MYKRALSKIAFSQGVSPRLIEERLLSPDDKKDLMEDRLSVESLELHVKLWLEMRMPDYAHGYTEI